MSHCLSLPLSGVFRCGQERGAQVDDVLVAVGVQDRCKNIDSVGEQSWCGVSEKTSPHYYTNQNWNIDEKVWLLCSLQDTQDILSNVLLFIKKRGINKEVELLWEVCQQTEYDSTAKSLQ